MKNTPRFFEIDFLRGIAVTTMVLYNWLFALDYLGIYRTAITSGFWFYFARITAAAFILLAGASLTLSASKGREAAYRIKRGLKIFSWGLIITAVTWLFLGEAYVRFGILHLIGLSIILALPLSKMRRLNLSLGIILIALGAYLQKFSFGFSWLLWLGFIPKNFYTVDYFPLLPWLGVFLIGIFLGNTLYKNGARKFEIRDLSEVPFVRAFSFLGRNSLLIYLMHQPVLLAGLWVIGFGFAF